MTAPMEMFLDAVEIALKKMDHGFKRGFLLGIPSIGLLFCLGSLLNLLKIPESFLMYLVAAIVVAISIVPLFMVGIYSIRSRESFLVLAAFMTGHQLSLLFVLFAVTTHLVIAVLGIVVLSFLLWRNYWPSIFKIYGQDKYIWSKTKLKIFL